MAGWVFESCDLCGESEGRDLLALKHPDAPKGTAYIRECQGCGLKRLFPRPGEEVIHQYYPQDYGAYVGRQRSPFKQAVWDFIRDGASGAPGRGRALRPLRPIFRRLTGKLFDINVPLDRDPMPRILDIGCGFGDLLLYWQSRGAEVLGIDVSPSAVKVARKLGLPILLGTLEEHNLEPETFDVIVFNHSLEHLPSPVRALREAASLSRPGGKLHITVPNGASHGFQQEGQRWAALMFPVHFWFFDVKTLLQSLATTGFSLERISTRNPWQFYFPTVKVQDLLRTFIQTMYQCFFKSIQGYSGDLICCVARRN